VKGNLNAARYIKILQESFNIPTGHLGYGDDYWYQDDDAPCHRATIVKDWQLGTDFFWLDMQLLGPLASRSTFRPMCGLHGIVSRNIKNSYNLTHERLHSKQIT